MLAWLKSKMSKSIVSQLEELIRREAEIAPAESNILYIEYDGSCEGRVSICVFGCSHPGNFDPEDPDDRRVLSDWNWESTVYDLPSTSDAIDAAFEEIRNRNHKWASARQIFFAEHDADVRPMFNQRRVRSNNNFYELHQASKATEVSSYRVGNVNEEPLLDHLKLVQDLDQCDYALTLESHSKRTDLLQFYRGWMICTAAVVELVGNFTEFVQVFNARVYHDEDETEPVTGYHIVNLYEKVDCIAEAYLLPPKWEDAPTTFDRSAGYRLDPTAVENRDIFRLNHEHYRLIVSQKFRDRWDELELTGASWLKRRTETGQET